MSSEPTTNHKMSIRISSLPPDLRRSVDELNLDVNGDGALDSEEIVMAVGNLATKSKDNIGLKKIIYGLCVFSVLLVGCVFGATIAAARLAKDTQVDQSNGIMYAKGSHETMKTEDVMIYSNTTNIVDMSNDDLNYLKVILLTGGDVKFQIKGYARSMDTDTNDDPQVKLLVEGGTITYDNAGIASATGDAQELLEFAYGVNTNTTDRRFLSTSESTSESTVVGGGVVPLGNTCCNRYGCSPC
jgi:hypothetical protein